MSTNTNIVEATLTPSQVKHMTKEQLVARFTSLSVSSHRYTETQMMEMTKPQLAELYNADIARLSLIDEVRTAGNWNLSRASVRNGSETQLRDLQRRMSELRTEMDAGNGNFSWTLPDLSLGEISLAVQNNPLTSWLYLAEFHDSQMVMHFYPEVFPRVSKESLKQNEDRVLSIVATVLSSVTKRTVTKDDVTKAAYAEATITVLEKRDWAEEDAEAVGNLLAQLKSLDFIVDETSGQPEAFVAPCDTAAEGFTYDEKSVVCRNCEDASKCMAHFNAIQSRKPAASAPRAKRDVFENPSAMTRVTMEVVRNPQTTKDQLIETLRNSGSKVPAEGSVIQQMGEALKHLRILAMLGYLTDDYAATIPAARRDVLSNPSAVTKVAIESARNSGTRSFNTVFEINQTSEQPISRDAAYYQYQDSQKVIRLVKEMNVFAGE